LDEEYFIELVKEARNIYLTLTLTRQRVTGIRIELIR
jgi:hypothetical protein